MVPPSSSVARMACRSGDGLWRDRAVRWRSLEQRYHPGAKQKRIEANSWRCVMKTLEAGKRIAMSNILFATDFSPHSNTALPYALAFARQYGAKLCGAHVVP